MHHVIKGYETAMESSTTIDTNYLHKKFKKQLNIEPFRKQNENKITIVESRQEKIIPPQIPYEYVPNNQPEQQQHQQQPKSTNYTFDTIKSSIISPTTTTTTFTHTNQQQSTCISYATTNLRPALSSSSDPINPQRPKDHQSSAGKYICTFCNLVCSKPSVLQKHIRAHTNERPYPCDSCGFSFKTRSNLYKHCRSRTHHNRVMGKASLDQPAEPKIDKIETQSAKPYKPRFHTTKFPEEGVAQSVAQHNIPLSEHINKIISRNNSIVYPLNDTSNVVKKIDNNNDYFNTIQDGGLDEPLNLTYKNRKRCMSEVVEPIVQKSLIKELLLKNLNYSDTQCPHCKMIFQTVTELELHKIRSCRGFTKTGAKYVRSSSVNVASILHKTAFEPSNLKSPGPCLGKTRLVESDKSKSYSYDDGLPIVNYLPFEVYNTHRKNVKMFGGGVKVTNETVNVAPSAVDDKVENRVIKSNLQSGGTMLTKSGKELEEVHSLRFDFEPEIVRKTLLEQPNSSPTAKFGNMSDFSQNAVKMLAPHLRQPNLRVPGIPEPLEAGSSYENGRARPKTAEAMNLFVNGQVVRYVPGIPGPVVDCQPVNSVTKPIRAAEKEKSVCKPLSISVNENRQLFARPNSLALKPTSTTLKQHHGLTPTLFNQILISPDTPRVAKKFIHHYLHGNYFSYLGLKSSTKPVYCTLNKTQPFYVPHFQKLSMYSAWRQQDTKTDKLYVSRYNSGQKSGRYTTAGVASVNTVVHSSYKFNIGDLPIGDKGDETQEKTAILGGYECNEDYTYIRGRGRGRYVCDQCGIRCKKPSMLKKHIRTHSNDRPYTCNHCNFSFKTKGNLTKHMKSKSHTKNTTVGSSSSSSTQQSGTQSSDSETDDSGMDSSDESSSARREEHEAAYGLLSLSQKPPEAPGGDAASGAARPLTYPYTTAVEARRAPAADEEEPPKCIKQFHVIKRYAGAAAPPPLLQLNDRPIENGEVGGGKRQFDYGDSGDSIKRLKNNEVMDLSMAVERVEAAEGEEPRTVYDNSAMETLADIATKQVKLERNVVAKSLATEYLKLATQHINNGENVEISEFVKSEGSKVCHICKKSFSKVSQLKLHMNIHYLERPFRCHPCAISFRTKGHLQKHERCATHHNKLSSSPLQSSSEPRPFKCVDCSIAFRIHGHLAKHLRSKMHIMKLECLSKIPFGLYAELERSNSLLTEINTADGDQCLESLKTLAKKVCIGDASKIQQHATLELMEMGETTS